MRALQKNKDLIAKTKEISKKGLRAEEEFQQIYLYNEDPIQKEPKIIKSLYISNIAHRTFSHNINYTIDERKASFFKEKIVECFYIHYARRKERHAIELDEKLVKRSQSLGIQIKSRFTACEVHILPNTPTRYEDYDPLFYIYVPAVHYKYFQFKYSFATCTILIVPENNAPFIELRVDYTPL